MNLKIIYEFIKNKIKEARPELLFAPGDYFNTLVLYVAEAMARVAQYANDLLYQSFYHRASGDILRTKAIDHEIQYNTGSYATGAQRFGRDTNAEQIYTIPAGTRVSTSTYSRLARNYRTTEEGFINIGQAAVDIPVEAIDWGEDYNAEANTITVLSDHVEGVEWTTNPDAVYGGSEHDTDYSIREKVLGYIRNIGRATIGALKYRAMVVPGVFSIAVDENPQGSANHSVLDPMLRYEGAWAAVEGENFHYGEAMTTSTEEDRVSFYFTGSAIHPILWAGDGVAEFYVDNEFVDAIDLSEDSSNMYEVPYHKHKAELVLRNGTLIFDGFKVFDLYPRDATTKLYLDGGAGMLNWETIKAVYHELDLQWKACGIKLFIERMRIELFDLDIEILWEKGALKTKTKAAIESNIALFVARLRPGENAYLCNIIPIVLGHRENGIQQIKCARILTPEFTLQSDKVYRLGVVNWHESH